MNLVKTTIILACLSYSYANASSTIDANSNHHPNSNQTITSASLINEGYFPDLAQDEISLTQSLENIKNHVLGTNTLTSSELNLEKTSIKNNALLFESNRDVIETAFEVVELYENNYGALFTSGTTTDGGIPSRTASGYELEHVILAIMQGILDYSYTEANLVQSPSTFNNRKFETSSFFPGAVTEPEDENISHTIKINGTHVKSFGIPANYETEDARRPTGCYLAPGSVAKVTVPPSLVGIGASILVGAHTWDLSNKSSIKRMDRVTTKYEITDESVTIANPLGGGIYINVPFENDLGILNITLENVVRSPYYANTVANKTTLQQWRNVERQREAPWTDFESDKVMMQVPTSWIYAMDDPSNMMNDWDLSMDAVSELFARPLIRSKTVVYSQVDVIMRGGANYPGYPQSNITYNPNIDYGGNYDNFLINGPRNARGYIPSVFFHELGHAENFHKFSGEVEASVNFLWVAVHNKKFGVELNKAFSESRYNLNHTIEEAAQSWMIAENFRNGNPMSTTTGQYRQEFAYQPRGYAKYADIVRLFGWQALEQFFHNLNVDYENGVRYSFHVSYVPWDVQSLQLSIASGYDLTPLLHFWGIHPKNPDALKTSIEANSLKASAAIYDQLMIYKTLPLANNDAFKAFALEDFSENSILNFSNPYNQIPLSYYQGFLNGWWDIYDTNEAAAAEQQVQNIIDLYFPDGRPQEQNQNTVVSMRKKNAMNFAIDGNHGGTDRQDVYLWQSNFDNVNQQWIELDRGQGYYTYQKNGTEYCLDGGNGGANRQNVFLWTCKDNNENQHWRKVDLGGEYYRLEKRNAPGYSIDGNRGGENGQSIYLWGSSDSNENQQWKFDTIN